MKNKELWSSKFGDDYTKRQKEDLDNRAFLFSDALKMVFSDIDSVCEFGANIGENLIVLKELFGFREKWLKNKKEVELSAVEINENCAIRLANMGLSKVYWQSVEKPIKEKFDLCFTRGVLIHLPKSVLTKTINNLYNVSNKYILIAEYITPKRRMVEYRGKKDMMWTDCYHEYFLKKGCQIIDCGFDPKYYITWILLSK